MMRSILATLRSFLATVARSFGISTPQPKSPAEISNSAEAKRSYKNKPRP
jgi:hypothetical protein